LLLNQILVSPNPSENAISRPPSRVEKLADKTFRVATYLFAWLTVLLVLYIVGKISSSASPAIQQRGLSFITGTTWDSNQNVYGILPEIWGTLYSSFLALALGTLFGVAAAVFLSEGFFSGFLDRVLKATGWENHRLIGAVPLVAESWLKNLIQLLAAIPSVVYGLWGIFVVIPLIREPCNWIHEQLGWIPIFGTTLSGPGMLPAALVLSIMILPTITAISRDALVAVPSKLREAAYGMGATRWEAIRTVIFPTASAAIVGSIVLALGRALGETMALAMLIGNANRISVSLFSPANTLAALLANNFPEAGPAEVSVLMYAALVLLAITLVVNLVGAFLLQQASADLKGMG
jgi:phosphate transport system permease protein